MLPWRHICLQDVLPSPPGFPLGAAGQATKVLGTDMLNDTPSEPFKLEDHLKDL
jgi:hypothetical protein